MTWTVQVQNIKCGGCARSIEKSVSAIPGVTGLSVNVEANEISVEGDPALRTAVLERLARLGYPERGAVAGFDAAAAKAKSFVSCAIGKVS
jgi:copper chaperone